MFELDIPGLLSPLSLVRPKSGKFVSLFLVFYIGGYVSAFLPPADELLPGQLSYLEEMGQEFPIDLSGGVVVSDDEVKDGAQDENTVFLPLSLPIGQTAGLVLNADENLVLFHRSARIWDENSFDSNNRFKLGPISNATIAVMDSNTGRLISEHGKNQFYMPHGLATDNEGNYWLTDVGTHQVYKLDKDFKPVMTLGHKLVPGSDDEHFCKPTDVAIASTGEFFVADGYCNSRIIKFSKNGKVMTKFGNPNSANPPRNGEFFVPHSLALIEDLNLLCVADRENERIQCFSAGLESHQHYHRRAYIPTGKFFTKAEGIGRIFAIREKQHYLVGITNRGSEQVEPQMFVMDINSGKANAFAKGLENVHAIAIKDNGDIFISQMEPSQIIKFSFPAEAMQTD